MDWTLWRYFEGFYFDSSYIIEVSYAYETANFHRIYLDFDHEAMLWTWEASIDSGMFLDNKPSGGIFGQETKSSL